MNIIKQLLSRVRVRRDPCPKCGSELMTDGEFVWCSQVPARDVATGRDVGGCSYGIRFLPVEKHEARSATRAVVVAQGSDDALERRVIEICKHGYAGRCWFCEREADDDLRR